jgi:membrane protease YdiL (CAAX protease family)
MSHTWLIALRGLLLLVVILGLYFSYSVLLGLIGRTILRYSREQWNQLRINRFWLVNMIFAPFTFTFAGVAAWALGFDPHRLGLNADQLGTSLLIALPLGLVFGLPSAITAPVAAKNGISPMKVPFGRTLADTIGAIAYAAILVGPLEEIIFRGILQTMLMEAMPQALHIGNFSIYLGTFVAAVAFVLYHYRNVLVGGESRSQFLLLIPGRTLVAFLVALLFQGTGSLIGPIIFHNFVDTCTIASLSITMYRMRQRGEWPPRPKEDVPEGLQAAQN